MRCNGNHSWPPHDSTSILIWIASKIGHIEADVMHIKARQAEIKSDVENLRRPPDRRPLTDYIVPATGLVILASAAAGKVTWSEALPSLLGLVGK